MEADRESARNFVYCYTRRDALEDGYHIDVSNVAAEAGIRFPVFLTRTVYERFVTVPPGVTRTFLGMRTTRSPGPHPEPSGSLPVASSVMSEPMTAKSPPVSSRMPGQLHPP